MHFLKFLGNFTCKNYSGRFNIFFYLACILTGDGTLYSNVHKGERYSQWFLEVFFLSFSQCRTAQWMWVANVSVLSTNCSLHITPSDFLLPLDIFFIDFFIVFSACHKSFWFMVSSLSLINLLMLMFRLCKWILMVTSWKEDFHRSSLYHIFHVVEKQGLVVLWHVYNPAPYDFGHQ